MSSNGFLQILDLNIFRLPWLLRMGQNPSLGIVRAVAQPSGSWVLFTADGAHHDARLIGGWVLAKGTLLGLCWQARGIGRLAAYTSVRLQAPDVGRRLLARLRWPLPEPATPELA
jgi:hypothetical protein